MTDRQLYIIVATILYTGCGVILALGGRKGEVLFFGALLLSLAVGAFVKSKMSQR